MMHTMRTPSRGFRAGPTPAPVLLLASLLGPLVGPCGAQDPGKTDQAPAQSRPQTLPHVRVDRAQRLVDLEATVVTREAPWLELLACSPGSREHEAILSIEARPSHVHLALLMLGLEPGAPLTWREQDGQIVPVPPHGPTVHVSIVLGGRGRPTEVPAGNWILNNQTSEPLGDSTWIFTGSTVRQFEGQSIFMADLGGTVISLVNFGDDLLARATDRTNKNDQEAWGPRVEAIPPVGTKVIVRLRPHKEAPSAAKPQ